MPVSSRIAQNEISLKRTGLYCKETRSIEIQSGFRKKIHRKCIDFQNGIEHSGSRFSLEFHRAVWTSIELRVISYDVRTNSGSKRSKGGSATSTSSRSSKKSQSSKASQASTGSTGKVKSKSKSKSKSQAKSVKSLKARTPPQPKILADPTITALKRVEKPIQAQYPLVHSPPVHPVHVTGTKQTEGSPPKFSTFKPVPPDMKTSVPSENFSAFKLQATVLQPDQPVREPLVAEPPQTDASTAFSASFRQQEFGGGPNQGPAAPAPIAYVPFPTMSAAIPPISAAGIPNPSTKTFMESTMRRTSGIMLMSRHQTNRRRSTRVWSPNRIAIEICFSSESESDLQLLSWWCFKLVVAIMMACLLTKLQRFESVGRRGAFSGFQRRAFVVRVVQMLEHEATFGALRTIDYNRFLVTVCLIFMLTAGLYKAQKKGSV
ncbi:hypothetical protein L1887_52805 [Cichorium endivia]|nr:hypothetical protein L1887_52805 [Cichorium endivia]